MRFTATCLMAMLVVSGVALAADTLTTYDGMQIRGRVLRLKNGRLEIQAEDEAELQKIAPGDVSQAKFVPAPPTLEKGGSLLLIDNDGMHGPEEKSAKIKLRKGLHAITLMYIQGTHGATLDFSWEGPGIKKQKVPPNVLSKWKSNATDVTYSAELDAEGFRLPDEIEETIQQAGYKLYEWDQNGTVTEVGDLRNLTLKKYGTGRQIDLNFQHAATNFGAVFYALLNVPKDGEYTFSVNSDDGSQLYFGKTPPIAQPTVREPKKDEWLLRLNGEAQLYSTLAGWDEQGIHCSVKMSSKGVDLAVPSAQLRELWSPEYAGKTSELDRSGEPQDADSVYAKNKDGQIQRVSGTVIGIAAESLKFDYQGTERTIALERVVAVIPRRVEPEQVAGPRRTHILFDFCGPNQLVGQLSELTPGSVAIELPWGETIEVSRNWVYKMQVLNGRMQSLQELEPAVVVKTPFFDHILPWQSGRSLTGGTLQIGDKTYSKGLCLHAQTRLTYELRGEFERFQCDLGLQQTDGAAGNALVRIVADGEDLFAADEVQTADETRSLDLDVTGKDQLVLEVDFGRNMHIGDHVVFGDARLLRPEQTP